MCEESVTFLLEAGMYALLFDPLDLENQAARIFKLYLDPESEGRISGCSDFELYRIQKILEQAKVLEIKKSKDRGSVRRDSDTTQITSLLFQVVAREVENTLNMDVWPRRALGKWKPRAATHLHTRIHMHAYAPHAQSRFSDAHAAYTPRLFLAGTRRRC